MIDHILKHGFITTEDLKDTYGYSHPPRAARDVREQGIPIETFSVTAKDGRRMAAYKFGEASKLRVAHSTGRTALSKELKKALIKLHGAKCMIYSESFEDAALQIDHRIPYEVAGDTAHQDPEDFMLLCPSANRAKSWNCENCENWKFKKDPLVCRTCYWAFPENYTHVAMMPLRRLDLLWKGNDVERYDALKAKAARLKIEVSELIKEILSRSV